MAHYTDWLPRKRDDILAMAKTWIAVFETKATGWQIPAPEVSALSDLTDDADTTLQEAKQERSPVTTQRCKTAFDALIAKMRFFKNRFFFIPPLTETDYVSLGFHLRDTTPTPSGTPTAQVIIETYLVGRHELGVKIIYVTGNPNDAANKGYRIWYSIVAPGETPPENPEDLRKSFYTKRKKDLIEFDFDASGKTAWFAVQVENDGKKGSWGQMVSALIP